MCIRDSVEVDLPSSGQYTITVSHKGNLTIPGNGPGGQGGVGPQDYSLIITGSNMTLSNSSNALSELLIWPNPGKDIVNFQFPSHSSSSSHLTMLDIQGRVVYKKSYNNISSLVKDKIETSNFEKGIYIINIRQGNRVLNEKVILN